MIHIVQLDADRRFEIARSAIESLHLDLSGGKTIHCWALVGSRGQLQLLPRTDVLSRTRDRLQQIAAERELTAAAASDREVDLFRKLSAFIEISVRPRKESIN